MTTDAEKNQINVYNECKKKKKCNNIIVKTRTINWVGAGLEDKSIHHRPIKRRRVKKYICTNVAIE